jgi:hypothetical protein
MDLTNLQALLNDQKAGSGSSQVPSLLPYGRMGGRQPGLTNGCVSRINIEAAVAATRGDLGQLAPRKKLLKSCRVSQKNF